MGKEGENKGGVSSSTGFCPQGSLIPPSHRDRAQESVRVRDLKIVHVTSHPPLPTPLKGSEAGLLKSLTPRSRLGGGGAKRVETPNRLGEADYTGRRAKVV